MIGSITEVQQQLAEQERRRQQIAARQSAAPVTSSLPVTAAPLATEVPAAGYAAPPAALKAAEPELARAGKRLPTVPEPDEAAIRWAKEILAQGYQAIPTDSAAAERIMEAADLDPDQYHAGKDPDSAPPGARAVAEAHRAREQAETDRNARKSYADRGATEGPGDDMYPGHLMPQQLRRPYITDGVARR